MTKRKYHKRADGEKADEELVVLILHRDPSCFAEIVARYQKKLLLYLWHLIGRSDEVEDLLQNVFAKVFEHLADFDTTRQFSPWIYRIAHNEAVNYLKKQSYRHLVDWETLADTKDKLALADERETPFETQMRDEARIAVRRALNTLPKKDRDILQLRYYLDKSYAEMSQLLHKPENTIASMLSRAKKKLLDELKITQK
ncbi:MAG: sigma-70 family RNA polymerase sigma factor [Candidatus Moraniibacteriota bacterium]